jgi:hypothetical protein
MPKTPIDYSKAIIYSIVCKTDDTLLYIGSTTEFTKRKNTHKGACINEKLRSHNYPVYVMIRANGGWDSFEMTPIKEFPCKNKVQLVIEEERIRKEMNAKLNTRKAFLSLEERMKNQQENQKKWHQENAEYVTEQQKKYYQANKQQIADQTKLYYEKNKHQIADQIKQYYEKNKQQIIDRAKQYYKTNAMQISETGKQYYEKNKEQINERRKQHYEKNKEQINERRRIKRQELKNAL